MKKRNAVWVIEYRIGSVWKTDVCGVHMLKRDAYDQLENLGLTDRKNYRIRKYVAEEADDEKA